MKIRNSLTSILLVLMAISAVACTSTTTETDVIVLSPYGVVKSEDAPPATIVRHFPEGEVRNAAHLGLLFSSPMVPLAEIGKPLADNPPIKITPHISGSWKWRDQRTLIFEPEPQRFNYSTMYKISVAGEIEGRGKNQVYSHDWEFSTKRLRAIERDVDWNDQLQRYIFRVGFNQPVDLAAIASFIVLTDGTKEYQATGKLIEDGVRHPRHKSRYPDAQTVEVMAKPRLPADTEMTWLFKAGMPAKEGELLAEEMEGYTFRTQKKLELTKVERDGDEVCITFSNNLLEEQDFKSLIKLAPVAEAEHFDVRYGRLCIKGLNSSLEYSVSIDKKLHDIYGQEFEQGDKQAIKIEVVKESARLLLVNEAHGYAPQYFDGAITLGPGEPRKIPFQTVNMNSFTVELRAVDPSEYEIFLNIQNKYAMGGRREALNWAKEQFNHGIPGTLVEKFKVNTKADINKPFSGAFDLTPALSEQGWGQLILMLEGVGIEGAYRDRNSRRMLWIQSTNLGLQANFENGKLTTWVTSLDLGRSVENAAVSIDDVQSTTDEYGVAVLRKDNFDGSLVAEKNGDIVFHPGSRFNSWHGNSWTKSKVIWHVFDDRAIYKPGETVTLKGTVRIAEPGKGLQFPMKGALVKWHAQDSKDNELDNGVIVLDGRRSFDFKLAIPKNIPLGRVGLILELINQKADESVDNYHHRLSVKEYRRPEYDVEVSFRAPPVGNSDGVVAQANAKYYSGEALAGAKVDWTFYGRGGHPSPEGWEQFEFDRAYYSSDDYYELGEAEGVTNHLGFHSAPLANLHHKGIDKVRAVASVQDDNNQRWSGEAEYALAKHRLYVGLRPVNKVVHPGDDVVVDVVVVNPNGDRNVRAELVVEPIQYKREERVTVTPQCQRLKAERVQRCIFKGLPLGGYRITASATDEKSKTYTGDTYVSVVGEKPNPEQYYPNEDSPWHNSDIRLELDKHEYQPGDIANVYIQTPFQYGEALVTFRQQGILGERLITIDNGYYHLQVPITENHMPNLWVRIDAVIDIEQAKKYKRGFTTLTLNSRINIPVSADSRVLSVNVATQKQRYAPKASMTATVEVKDIAGEPVNNAEVTFYAVDDAVLDSAGYKMPSPSDIFYKHRGDSSWGSYNTRDSLAFLYSDLGHNYNSGIAEMMAGGGRGGKARGAVRKDFSALATFQTNLRTDPQGRVSVNFTLPDSLTRYKLIAVVQAGADYFGSGDAAVEAYLPLMVRPSFPRFLNMGDRAKVPVVLQNSTDTSMTVNVRAQGAGLTVAKRGNNKKVTIPAQGRVHVEFSVQPKREGTAEFKVSATASQYEDSISVEVPIYSPAREMAITHCGNLSNDKAKFRLMSPKFMQANSGQLEVSSSVSQLQSLEDAYVYLLNYPYSCSEQLSSRILSVVSLEHAEDIFSNIDLPDEKALNETLTSQIDQLVKRQNDDGGWNLWRKDEPSEAFVSVHVVHALTLAKKMGYDVTDSALELGFGYLEGAFIEDLEDESWSAAMQALAYAIYVNAEQNRSFQSLADHLSHHMSNENNWSALSVSALGWLIHAFSGIEQYDNQKAQLYRSLNTHLLETPSEAEFREDFGSWRHSSMASSARANAIVLSALLKDQPNSELIGKLVRGIVADRTAGRWRSTQENVFVLLALKAYYEKFESDDVNLTFNTALNGKLISRQTYKEAGVASNSVITSLDGWGRSRKKMLASVSAEGEGRVFYRIAASYAPSEYKQDAASNGFSVDRHYEAVNDPDDVLRLKDGTWRIRAGAEVRVILAMNTQESRYHVALVDSLPAGLEPVDTSLANIDNHKNQQRSEQAEPAYKSDWYEHSQLKDAGAQAFAQRLPAGGYRYSYTARAITPGEYTAPALRAEEMYNPEVFGRSNSSKVVVY